MIFGMLQYIMIISLYIYIYADIYIYIFQTIAHMYTEASYYDVLCPNEILHFWSSQSNHL